MIASTAPVLKQITGRRWQTTVLVSGFARGCPTAAGDYSLQTIPPSRALTPVKVTAVSSGRPGPAVGSPPVAARSCEVRLTFSGLPRVPATATLVVYGSSALTLTVVRTVTFFYYLGIPAAIGGGMAVVLLLLCLAFVPVYDRKGGRERLFAGRRRDQERPSAGFWKHQVYAAGAWSLNDSWATNIAAAGAVITTALGLISATDTLFPGVTLDRFLILNALAAGIVTAAPLVLALRYARWLHKYPGLSDEARLSLPRATPPRVDLPGMTALLLQPVKVLGPEGRIVELPAAARLDLPPSTLPLSADSPISLADGSTAMLVTGTLTVLPQHALVRQASGDKEHLGADTSAHLAAAAEVTPVHERFSVAPSGLGLLTLPASPGQAVRLPADTPLALAGPGHRTVTLVEHTPVALPHGAVATISPATLVPLGGLHAVLPGSTTARVHAHPGHELAEGTQITTLYRAAMMLQGGGHCDLSQLRFGPAAEVCAPSGAVVAVPWGASLTAPGPPAMPPTPVPAGQAIQLPPDSIISVRAAGLTLPTGSDLFVTGDSIVQISSTADVLTVPASEVAAAHGHPDNDVTLQLPVQVAAPGGAKITVNGTGQITLPAGTKVRAPHRHPICLTAERRRFRWPQGGNTLAGTVGMVILAALVTVFGIGAELGLVAVLTVGLSQASTLGRVVAGAIVAAVGLFTLWYAVTAIRTLVDPQPGSSMSATAGTSFTL